MRSLQKTIIIKKFLIVLITIIMLTNFVMPNSVYAAATLEEKLVSGIFYLFAYVGDAGIQLMQYMMKGTDDIGTPENPEIKYSPGLIFAGDVEMLDINFITASEENGTIEMGSSSDDDYEMGTIIHSEPNLVNLSQNAPEEILKTLGYNFDTEDEKEAEIRNLSKLISENGHDMTADAVFTDTQKVFEYKSTKLMVAYVMGKEYGETSEYVVGKAVYIGGSEGINTPAYALQKNIATWYKALRTIAIVGLLSVLVYIGIRIILSSASAQDKAKYKNMLKDWLIAICILFLLHYAMAFMLQINSTLKNIIVNNVVKETSSGTTDNLMNEVRRGIKGSYDDASIGDTAGYVIMYLALVILTGVFTVQYLKRVIYMAFLTMIAPMIALTYPLDKIKDGKAQAFNFWLREYLFNCLIQPVHLLLYTVLISDAGNLATVNVLYAIIVIGFLVPAEKFIKSMFGMKSQSPVGTLGAAAGGALVMNMLGKIRKKPPKEEAKSGGASNSKSVRTATNNVSADESGNTGGVVPTAGTGGTSNNNGGQVGGSGLRRQRSANTGGSSGTNSTSSTSSTSTTAPSITRGLRNAGKNMAIRGVDSIKSASLNLAKSAPGAPLGATIGAAATVASGGEKAGTFIAGGITAGAALSSNIASGAGKFAKDTYEDYQKGKYGIEGYNNKKFDDKFFKSEDYKLIVEDASLLSAYGGASAIKTATQRFLDNGITDANQIRTALMSGISGDEYKEYSNAGITNVKEMKKAKEWTIEGDNGTRKSVSASYYANLKKIAKIAKNKSKEEFVDFVQNIRLEGREIRTEEAEEIYRNIIDLL